MKKAFIKVDVTNSTESAKESTQRLKVVEEDPLDSLFPRVDISDILCGDIATNLMSSNWKIRKEGLDAIITTLDGANKRIKPSLGSNEISI